MSSHAAKASPTLQTYPSITNTCAYTKGFLGGRSREHVDDESGHCSSSSANRVEIFGLKVFQTKMLARHVERQSPQCFIHGEFTSPQTVSMPTLRVCHPPAITSTVKLFKTFSKVHMAPHRAPEGCHPRSVQRESERCPMCGRLG